MKNAIKLLGVIALAAVIGFSMAACGGDSNPTGGGDDLKNPTGNSGKLTINGLPVNGTQAVYLFQTGTDISTYTEILDAYTNTKYIAVGVSENSDNNFVLFRWVNNTQVEEYFSSSGNFPVLLLNTAGSITDSSNPMYSWVNVSFTNGVGTVNYNQFEAVLDDSLAIAAITTELLTLSLNDSNTPHDVSLSVNIKSLSLTGDPLGIIFSSINGKYINLDLSACTGTVLSGLSDPAYTITFNGNSNRKYLVSIILPNSVTDIGAMAFYKCTSLKTVTLPNSLKIVRSYAFQECNAIESLDLPNTLEEIHTGAFYGCNLDIIDLPASVKMIQDSIFYVNSETLVIVRASTPPNANMSESQYIFAGGLPGYGSSKGTPSVIYVPDASVIAYKAANKWNDYSDIIKPISEMP